MQDDGKGKHANARYMLPSGTPSPPSWLTDRVQGNTHSTGRKLELLHTDFEAVPWWLHDLFVVVCGVMQCLRYVGREFLGSAASFHRCR